MAGKPKVMLVLSDPTFAGALAKFLATRGFEPVLVKGAAGAMEAWKDVKPEVVVCTQLLPGGTDGPTLCRKIKDERPGLPFIIIAAVSSSAGITDVKRISGAEQVLPATMAPEMLVNALRKATTPLPVGGRSEDSGSFKRKTAPPPAPAGPREDTASFNIPTAVVPPIEATRAVEEQMRSAPAPTGRAPVEPAPEQPAVANTPPVPIEPAWIVSRALADNVTGALRFVSGAIERILYFAQGRPIVVTSNAPEERIGQILIRKGRLAPRELETALALVQKKGRRLADIIVEMGVMTMKEHDEELADQYAERALALFGWREASVEFRPYPAPDELVHIRLAPERLILEGLRRHYDVARLEQVLADPNRVPRIAPDAVARIQYLALSPGERAALRFVDGTHTIGDAVSVADNRIESLRAIYACLCLNILV